MTAKNVSLVQTQYLPAAAAQLYVADQKTAFIGAAMIANSSGVDANFTLYIVPSGQSLQGSNKVTDQKRVRPNEEYRLFAAESQTLAPGDSIWALASVSSALTIRISGVEIV